VYVFVVIGAAFVDEPVAHKRPYYIPSLGHLHAFVF
jgi:hypothetical protein